MGIQAETLQRRGIGEAKAASVLASLELARRLARAEIPERELLDRPAEIARYLVLRYAVRDQEVMGALYLDARHRLIAESRDLQRHPDPSRHRAPADPVRRAWLLGPGASSCGTPTQVATRPRRPRTSGSLGGWRRPARSSGSTWSTTSSSGARAGGCRSGLGGCWDERRDPHTRRRPRVLHPPRRPNPALREGLLVLLAGEPENQETLRRFGDLLHTMVGETVRTPCPVPLVYAEAEAALVDLLELTERLQDTATYVDVDEPEEVQLGAVTGKQAKVLRKVIAALEAGLVEMTADEEDDGKTNDEEADR